MDFLPQFGTIVDIVVLDTDMHYLVCESFVTDSFSHHFHAYKAYKSHPIDYVVIKPSQLYDHSILAAYTLDTYPNFYFIPLKYQLMDKF